MANTFKRIFNNSDALLSSGNTTFTSSTSVSATIVSAITICNTTSATTSTIAIYQGGSAAANMIQPAITLNPGEKMVMTGPKTLAAGDTLVFAAGTSSVLSILIEGDEYTQG